MKKRIDDCQLFRLNFAGFRDRGVLRPGCPADVVVYDPGESQSVFPMEVVHDLPGGEWRRIQKASRVSKCDS